jgi:signal transduction histidine kinase
MVDRLIQRWSKVVSPFWAAPLFLGLAVLFGLLTQVVERGRFEPSFERAPWPTATSFILVGVHLAAWLLETSGLRWPRLLFAAVAIVPTCGLLLYGRDTIAPLMPMVVIAWVAYAGTRREGILTLILALMVLLLPFLIGRNVPDRGVYRNLLAWTIAALVSWASGYILASQRRLMHELRAAQADLARQAAAEERRRIAREVHDLVAHSLAITMLHLTGARYHMVRDPQRAAEALAQAERLGRQSMADIRRTVGLLDSDGHVGANQPLPGVDDLPDLVAEFARAGLDVRYTLAGDAASLSPAAGLGLYRITQEALSNAARHAPGATVAVDVAVGEREVVLRVRDSGSHNDMHSAGATSGSGLGISGMRERAALLGGTLVAHADGLGGLVECRFPAAAG